VSVEVDIALPEPVLRANPIIAWVRQMVVEVRRERP
jgi:hypothetical protein